MPDEPHVQKAAAPAALSVIMGAGAVLGFLFSATLPGPFTLTSHPVVLGALTIALLSAVPAATSAFIPAAARHTYNLHYVFFLGVLSIALIIPGVSLLQGEKWQGMRHIFTAGLLIGGPWALSHLAAATATSPQAARATAFFASMLAIMLLRPVGGIILPLLAAAFLALLAALLPRQPEAPASDHSNPGRALFAFLLLNMVALVGLAPVVLLILIPAYSLAEMPQDLSLSGYASADLPAALAANWQLLGLRYGGLLAGVCAPALVTFAWPRWHPTRTTLLASAALLFAAAALGGRTSVTTALTAQALALLLVSLATCALASDPPSRRVPHALIAAALGALIVLQGAAPAFTPPTTGLIFVLLDSAILAVIFAIAYLAGVRTLRNRSLAPPPAAP